MPTTTSTRTATTSPAGKIVQSVASAASSSGASTPTQVTTPTTIPPTQQKVSWSPKIESVASTPPTLRPSSPSMPAGTPRSPPPSTAASTIKPLATSKWVNHLSHISIATWIGVSLALGGLAVTVYYGIPMMRLATWTAQNDFREACKSESETGLQQTAECNKTLGQPAQPPPVKKRAASAMGNHSSWELAHCLLALAISIALLLMLCQGVQSFIRKNRYDQTPNNASIKFSTQLLAPPTRSILAGDALQNTSQVESLSFEQLIEAVLRRFAFFEESHSRSDVFALILGGLIALLTTMMPYHATPVLALSAVHLCWNLAWIIANIPLIVAGMRTSPASEGVSWLFQCFSFVVYACLRFIWPVDTLVFYVVTGVIWTALSVCLRMMPFREQMSSPELTDKCLQWSRIFGLYFLANLFIPFGLRSFAAQDFLGTRERAGERGV